MSISIFPYSKAGHNILNHRFLFVSRSSRPRAIFAVAASPNVFAFIASPSDVCERDSASGVENGMPDLFVFNIKNK
jgi:hypothetical protein